MIEIYKNLCILKAFDVPQSVLKQCKKCVVQDGLDIIIEENALDCKVCLVNKTESEVAYFEVLKNISQLLEEYIYSDCDKSLEECVVKLAINKNIKIGCAESLTGGLLSASLVNVAGCSKVLEEGIVTYTNTAKVRLLHVKTSTLENYGAVSRQTAEQMAQSIVGNKDITLAMATTGCAGPESDEFDTPIGMVYIAYGAKDNIIVEECMFEGTRNEIRQCSVNKALYLSLNYIKKYL